MLESYQLDAGSAVSTMAHAELQCSSQPSISVTRRQSILFVTSEISDYIKAGGLGEVSAALPRALRHHYDVRILIPGYRQVLSQIGAVEEVARLPASYGIPACSLGRATTRDGLIVYVLLCPELYDRDGSPYVDSFGVDWCDNDIRFARLGLAAADIASGSGDPLWRADLLHLNDWPSGLASAYLVWRGQRIPTILTIHNLAYQGNFERSRLSHLGIPDAAFHIEGVEFYGKVSFLKAGIYYSSHITTVSSTYAQEITRPEFGCGLDGLLRARAEEGRLDGIINGIDESWDPSTDPYLVSRFSAENCRGKRANAESVRRSFGLALNTGPLFAVVSRLVHQKGVDLAISAAETIVSQGGQIAFIGQGEPRFEAELQALAGRHPGSIGVKIGYDEGDARRMYAGSDFLLMPSRFEPCGLSQMYAQRFGSLPIAHRTGGLADTIEDGVNGFLFGEPSLNRFKDAIKRGLDTFRSRSRLIAMRRAAMKRPHGWDRSASRYQEVYERACHAAFA